MITPDDIHRSASAPLIHRIVRQFMTLRRLAPESFDELLTASVSELSKSWAEQSIGGMLPPDLWVKRVVSQTCFLCVLEKRA